MKRYKNYTLHCDKGSSGHNIAMHCHFKYAFPTAKAAEYRNQTHWFTGEETQVFDLDLWKILDRSNFCLYKGNHTITKWCNYGRLNGIIEPDSLL